MPQAKGFTEDVMSIYASWFYHVCGMGWACVCFWQKRFPEASGYIDVYICNCLAICDDSCIYWKWIWLMFLFICRYIVSFPIGGLVQTQWGMGEYIRTGCCCSSSFVVVMLHCWHNEFTHKSQMKPESELLLKNTGQRGCGVRWCHTGWMLKVSKNNMSLLKCSLMFKLDM